MKLNLVPTIETNQLNIEKEPELIAVPIFRANDLYNSIFPEIKPVFGIGEEPNAKRIFEVIKANNGENVMLDMTCYKAIHDLQKVTLEDFPKEFKLKEIPEDAGQVDLGEISKMFKEEFDVTLDSYSSNTIDMKIARSLGENFSPELVQSLFEIAKQKNSNIQKVYILSDNISDHVRDFPKDKVLDSIKEKVQSEFGLSPIVVPTLNKNDIKAGDLIVLDRHNTLVNSLTDPETYKIPKDFSLQVSLLPLETELHNNEQLTDKKIESGTLVETLRKSFEKLE